MNKHTPLLLIAFGLLAACSTPGETLKINGVNMGYATVFVGDTPNESFVDGKKLQDAVADPTFDIGPFKAWVDESKVARGYIHHSDSGAATAFVASVGTMNYPHKHTAEQRSAGLTFLRHIEPAQPPEGTAKFIGKYAGMRRAYYDGEVESSIIYSGQMSGDVTLNADFSNSEVSGSITNRLYLHAQTNEIITNLPLSDITLHPTVINSDGSYSGNATGGGHARDVIVDPEIGGTYSGLIAGESAQETVGGVILPVINPRDNHPRRFNYLEFGVFIAEEP
ncbi:MAG: hypothetical protein ACRBBK_07565 [Paracoccaceae bacterium]